jgi:hypothetical protein
MSSVEGLLFRRAAFDFRKRPLARPESHTRSTELQNHRATFGNEQSPPSSPDGVADHVRDGLDLHHIDVAGPTPADTLEMT